MKIRIESPTDKDGVVTARGTRVFMLDGLERASEITHIESLVVQYPLDGAVTATISCYVNPRAVEANALLALDTVREAAAHYGFKLVRSEEGLRNFIFKVGEKFLGGGRFFKNFPF